MNAKKTNSKDSASEQMVEQVEGTPFTLVTSDKGKFLAMGKYRLTEILKTPEEIEAAKKDESWFRVMQVVQCMIDAQQEFNKLKAEMEAIQKAQKEGLTMVKPEEPNQPKQPEGEEFKKVSI